MKKEKNSENLYITVKINGRLNWEKNGMERGIDSKIRRKLHLNNKTVV
jgi:hypothetical protein